MFDEFVVPELEANLVASFDIVGLRSRSLRTFVTDEIWRIDDVLSEGRHVGVGVLADVGVIGADRFVVDDQLGEDVVPVDERRCQQRRCEEKSS